MMVQLRLLRLVVCLRRLLRRQVVLLLLLVLEVHVLLLLVVLHQHVHIWLRARVHQLRVRRRRVLRRRGGGSRRMEERRRGQTGHGSVVHIEAMMTTADAVRQTELMQRRRQGVELLLVRVLELVVLLQLNLVWMRVWMRVWVLLTAAEMGSDLLLVQMSRGGRCDQAAHTALGRAACGGCAGRRTG
jgi:hypothetical protein